MTPGGTAAWQKRQKLALEARGGLLDQTELPSSPPGPLARRAILELGKPMIYMVIEDFHDGDPVPVYRRFRDSGRQLPNGLKYLGSWITQDLTRCYQVMESDDPILLDEWMSRWTDVMSFQVIPVVTSPEAVAMVSSRL